MKIQFEGKVIKSDSLHIDKWMTIAYAGHFPDMYDFIKKHRQGTFKVTLEYETPIEACLLCQGEVTLVKVATKKWRFECTNCATLVVLYAPSREEAIQYFNQGEPR